MGTAKVIKPPD